MGLRTWQVRPSLLKGERCVLAFCVARHRGAAILDAAAFAGYYAQAYGAVHAMYSRGKRHGFSYPRREEHITTFRRHAAWWVLLGKGKKWPAGATPFIRCICDNFLHAGPFLVFSDWLEERGDKRAEIFRILFQSSQGAFK